MLQTPSKPPIRSNISSAAQPPVTPFVPSIPLDMATNKLTLEKRSELLGSSVSRDHRIPLELCHFLLRPLRSDGPIPAKETLVEAVEQLVAPVIKNASRRGPSNTELIDRLSHGIATSLRWISQSLPFNEAFTQTLSLHALLPLYIVAGQGQSTPRNENETIGTPGIGDSLVLLRDLISLIEIRRCTSDSGFHEWLYQPTPMRLAPHHSIERAFRLSLTLVSHSFWKNVASSTLPAEKNNRFEVGGFDHQLSNSSLISGWWSLASQWTERRVHLSIPAEVSVGVVQWDKLQEHWQRVCKILLTTKQPSAKSSSVPVSNVGPNATTSKQNASSESVLQSNTLRQNETTTSVTQVAAPDTSRVTTLPPATTETTSAVTASRTTPPEQPDETESVSTETPSILDFDVDDELIKTKRIIEIRSSNDPQLSSNLDQLLSDCRSEQGTLTLVVMKNLEQPNTPESLGHHLLPWHAKIVELIDLAGESQNVRGFLTDAGELSMVFENVERSEVSQWIREAFSTLNQSSDSALSANRSVPLVAGVASVSSPSRSFRIEQLIQSAWRCLDGATSQGASAIKTIEVF